jgi:hypothetical protein
MVAARKPWPRNIGRPRLLVRQQTSPKDVEEIVAHTGNRPRPPDEIDDEAKLIYEPRIVSQDGFREHQPNKSFKAVIGVGILLVLSIVLYEIKSTLPDTHASSTAPTISRDVANDTHMPKEL